MRWIEVDFDALARSFDCCRKSVENARHELAETQLEFVFERVRVGRSFRVVIKLPAAQISDGSPAREQVFPYGKNKNTNTAARLARKNSAAAPPQGGFDPEAGDGRTAGAARKNAEIAAARGRATAKIARLAFFLARHRLLPAHWDNCKVAPRFGHARNFARRALLAGHRAENIVIAYGKALHQRHKDATDCGLKIGNPELVFEPSSTVSLAADLLARHFPGDADTRRAEMRREIAARPAAPAVRPVRRRAARPAIVAPPAPPPAPTAAELQAEFAAEMARLGDAPPAFVRQAAADFLRRRAARPFSFQRDFSP